jgi:GTP-binding protein
VVSGTNYCILCEARVIVPDAAPYYALVYVYADLKGGAELLNIAALNLGDIAETGEIKDADPASGNLLGGWKLDRESTVEVDGALLHLASQLVNGTNHCILCQGGKGGWGNDHFKSATNKTPRYAQPGEEGQEGWFILELKVLADVGLVGFPNAGKSTLLAAITSAKPKIANYAFTTLEPNLGIVRYFDNRSFVMADIPGIIEGAHEGKGIGMRFLRHIERNSVLLFMVAADEPDVTKGYKILLKELEEYNPELLVKDRVLAVTKTDLIDEKQRAKIEKKLPSDLPHVFISSVAQTGLNELKEMLWKALNP